MNPPPREHGSRIGAGVLRWGERLFLVVVIGLLFLLFSRISPGWMNGQTVQFVVAQSAPLEVVTVGMTFAMISGNIDLSPGSMLSLAGMVTGLVYARTGSLYLGLLVSLALCVIVGAVTGVLVGRLKISAIVVTLATYIWAAGLATAINSSNAIQMNGSLLRLLDAGRDGVTVTILVVALTYLAGHVVLQRTKFGRYSRALGGNFEFTRRAGVPVRRYVLYVFLFMSLTTWLGTVLSVAQLGAAQPLAGSGLELQAIVAVVIGGTRLTGGEGSMLRSALGALLLAVLGQGLSSLGLSDAYYSLWEGVAVIVVLAASVLLQRAVRRDERRARVPRGPRRVEGGVLEVA